MTRTRTALALLILFGGGALADSALADSPKVAAHGARPAPATRPTTTRPAPAPSLAEITRAALAASGARLPKGATVTAVHATAAVEVPATRDRVTIEVTAPARRAGSVSTPALLTFWKAADITARLPVIVELSVPPEALVFEVVKGAALSLVVRRGLVEVTAPAVLAVDADVGDVVQVLLRPSGRALRAQLVAKDRAVAVDDAR